MEQSANEGEECGICLDALKNPVALPCSHKFCSKCLNGWRSKYGAKSGDKETNTKCPLCREKIPPSKEMITQLKFYRNIKSRLEEMGDTFSEDCIYAKSRIEDLERDIEDWRETIDYSDDEYVVLPTDIWKAASANDIQKVLNWLGPLPVDTQRINAKDQDGMDFTLLIGAVLSKHSDLLSILLQLGADVDAVAANGWIPLGMCMEPEHYAEARLLLEWGAEISNCASMSKNQFIEYCLGCGNIKLANLLKSEFGGRRCEIINLPNRPDLVGKTCVVEKYLPKKGKYKIVFETTKEVGMVSPQRLKRRDRTPDDCGYYISYKNGSTTRHDFASKEEYQAFVGSLTEEEKSGEVGADECTAEAEARAEEAAAPLLAERAKRRGGNRLHAHFGITGYNLSLHIQALASKDIVKWASFAFLYMYLNTR